MSEHNTLGSIVRPTFLYIFEKYKPLLKVGLPLSLVSAILWLPINDSTPAFIEYPLWFLSLVLLSAYAVFVHRVTLLQDEDFFASFHDRYANISFFAIILGFDVFEALVLWFVGFISNPTADSVSPFFFFAQLGIAGLLALFLARYYLVFPIIIAERRLGFSESFNRLRPYFWSYIAKGICMFVLLSIFVAIPFAAVSQVNDLLAEIFVNFFGFVGVASASIFMSLMYLRTTDLQSDNPEPVSHTPSS